jgi:hypothetical protein
MIKLVVRSLLSLDLNIRSLLSVCLNIEKSLVVALEHCEVSCLSAWANCVIGDYSDVKDCKHIEIKKKNNKREHPLA